MWHAQWCFRQLPYRFRWQRGWGGGANRAWIVDIINIVVATILGMSWHHGKSTFHALYRCSSSAQMVTRPLHAPPSHPSTHHRPYFVSATISPPTRPQLQTASNVENHANSFGRRPLEGAIVFCAQSWWQASTCTTTPCFYTVRYWRKWRLRDCCRKNLCVPRFNNN